MVKIKQLLSSFFDHTSTVSNRKKVSSILHKVLSIEHQAIDDMLKRLVYLESVEKSEATDEIVQLVKKEQVIKDAHDHIKRVSEKDFDSAQHYAAFERSEQQFKQLFSTLHTLLVKIQKYHVDREQSEAFDEDIQTLDNVVSELAKIISEEEKIV